MRRLILALILLNTLCMAQVKEIRIKISKDDTLINLPHRFIIPGSEILKIDSILILPGIHYTIDYGSGKIILNKNLLHKFESEVEVYVHYKAIPIEDKFFKYRKITSSDSNPSTGETHLIETKNDASTPYFGNIRKNGSIVRGFTLGSNRDLVLQSGFNLQLSGNLTKDVEVVASLTDENIPIQPEGNTQTLQEIDKIFIQVKSKNLFATFGDYDIGYQFSDEKNLYFKDTPEFASLRRRLQGGKFQGEFEGGFLKTRNTFAIASSRGKFATNYFNGIDGLQGPYKLTGQNGERDIIIIAGTEKVYVDGELMMRGESNDYVIDYSTAEITFTPNRLITSASRITVDFQYTDRKYARNFFGIVSDNLFLDEKFNFTVSYFYDADNKNAPIDIALTQSDIEILRSSGDDQFKAVKSGVIFVGFDSVKGIGKGQYVKKDTLIDSTKLEIFVYSPGDKEALYSVSFSYVGHGKGDYIRKGIGKYEFAGKGKGEYLPIVFIPAPQSSQLFDLKAKYKIEKFEFSLETGISNFDKNQFSNLDDGDNRGLALKYGLAYSSGEISDKGLRKINFNLFQRQINKNFVGIDRYNAVEFNRRWNLMNESENLNESIIESSLQIELFRKSLVVGSFGVLKNEDKFKTNRTTFEVKFEEDKLPEFRNVAEILISKSSDLNSKWLRDKGGARYKVGFLSPFVNYEAELKTVKRGDSLSYESFRFTRLIPGFLFYLKKLTFEFSYETRFDDVVKGGTFSRASVTKNQNYKLKFESNRFGLNADLTFNKKTFTGEDTKKEINNAIARLQGRMELFNSSIRSNFIYRAMTRLVTRLEPIFIKVQPGTGNYRYLGDLNRNGIQDPNEFELTKFDGDYIMLTVPGTESIPTANVEASLNVRFSPGRLSKIFSSLSTETYFQVSESSVEPWQRIYFLKFRYFQQENKTINGALTIRQDVLLFENNKKFNLRYRILKTGAMYSYNIATRTTSNIENSVRLRWYPEEELGFQWEVSRKAKKSTGGFKFGDTFEIQGKGLNLEIFYKPFNFTELSLGIGVARNNDFKNNKKADLNRQSVKLSWLFINKGRIDFEVERNEAITGGVGNIVYELVEGNYQGKILTFRLTGSYNVGDYIQVNGNYNARLTSGSTVHIAQVEVRVYF